MGDSVGSCVGDSVGSCVGDSVGSCVGSSEGVGDGVYPGEAGIVGWAVGGVVTGGRGGVIGRTTGWTTTVPPTAPLPPRAGGGLRAWDDEVRHALVSLEADADTALTREDLATAAPRAPATVSARLDCQWAIAVSMSCSGAPSWPTHADGCAFSAASSDAWASSTSSRSARILVVDAVTWEMRALSVVTAPPSRPFAVRRAASERATPLQSMAARRARAVASEELAPASALDTAARYGLNSDRPPSGARSSASRCSASASRFARASTTAWPESADAICCTCSPVLRGPWPEGLHALTPVAIITPTTSDAAPRFETSIRCPPALVWS